jgi:outer membrane protein OmpA-like peptidoglycan-associated protein
MKKLTLMMILVIASLLFVTIRADAAQEPNTAGLVQVRSSGQNPIYTITINVVERRATAINYRHRSGATKIDFRGTPLMSAAHGEAKVESKQGYIEIEVEFRELQSATRFGPEFLTYVMWAITPEGRASNLGEVILNGKNSKLDVSTELQAFGLIVTAEPYFGVTQPSDVVVMENFIRKDTVGKIEEIDAKYELLQRGQYTVNVQPADLKPMILDQKTPLDLYEARNAVRIAKWMGADVTAAETFQKASKLLEQAENYQTQKAGSKQIAMASREAVQTAEDARLITLKRQEEERQAQERTASAGREAEANDAANQAKTAAVNAMLGRAQAEAESATAQAQAERTKMEAELAAQRAASEKDAALAQSTREKEEALALSNREKETALAQSEQTRRAASEQAEQEKQELRNKLAVQLNLILETRDSARGLIVNMSDVLFDTGKFTLRPVAREKLSVLSGIIQGHPSLRLEVEGHTDSVGTEQYNMKLSDDRANAVRDYLVLQGNDSSLITAHGFGENQPVASNDTVTGRQLNRRVELIVSGDEIGTPIGVTSGARLQR